MTLQPHLLSGKRVYFAAVEEADMVAVSYDMTLYGIFTP